MVKYLNVIFRVKTHFLESANLIVAYTLFVAEVLRNHEYQSIKNLRTHLIANKNDIAYCKLKKGGKKKCGKIIS